MPCARPRHLLADRRGTAAVEFAFVSTALVAMLMAIIHVGYCLYVQSALDQAAAGIASKFATGGLQGVNVNGGSNAFANVVCPYTQGLVNCAKIQIYVCPTADYSQLTSPPCPANGNSAGFSRSPMILQLAYPVPIPTWPVLSLAGGSSLTVTSSLPYVNEF